MTEINQEIASGLRLSGEQQDQLITKPPGTEGKIEDFTQSGEYQIESTESNSMQ